MYDKFPLTKFLFPTGLSPLTGYRGLASFVAVLVLSALACNAPLGESTPEPAPATNTPTDEPEEDGESLPQETPTTEQQVAPAQTLQPVLSPSSEEEPSATALPTFTPISQPTLAATREPTSTPTRRPTFTPVPATVAPVTPENAGPLEISYRISWRLKPDNPFVAISTITVDAKGGGGGYVYWVDQESFTSSTLEFERQSCQPDVHTLKVDSADGQSVSQEFYSVAPCPTPTPTPHSN